MNPSDNSKIPRKYHRLGEINLKCLMVRFPKFVREYRINPHIEYNDFDLYDEQIKVLQKRRSERLKLAKYVISFADQAFEEEIFYIMNLLPLRKTLRDVTLRDIHTNYLRYFPHLDTLKVNIMDLNDWKNAFYSNGHRTIEISVNDRPRGLFTKRIRKTPLTLIPLFAKRLGSSFLPLTTKRNLIINGRESDYIVEFINSFQDSKVIKKNNGNLSVTINVNKRVHNKSKFLLSERFIKSIENVNMFYNPDDTFSKYFISEIPNFSKLRSLEFTCDDQDDLSFLTNFEKLDSTEKLTLDVKASPAGTRSFFKNCRFPKNLKEIHFKFNRLSFFEKVGRKPEKSKKSSKKGTQENLLESEEWRNFLTNFTSEKLEEVELTAGDFDTVASLDFGSLLYFPIIKNLKHPRILSLNVLTCSEGCDDEIWRDKTFKSKCLDIISC